MGIPSYGLRPPRPGMPGRPPIPRQNLLPSPYLDDVIGELPEKNPMWPPPEGVGEIGEQMPGPPPGQMSGGPPPPPLPPPDPYLTDQIREQTQLSPIKPPPAMPMQMPGPDPANPTQGQFRAANIPPMGQPGMPPIPSPDNARQAPVASSGGGSPELDYLRQLQSTRPERPQPKWWQIAGAAAAGGLEGYLASSPSAATRSAVRQPGRLSQQFIEGDYPQRLQDWQVDLKNAQALLDSSLDIQKARSQQQVQEAQAWRYKNEPGIKADTALDVQESRNQGAVAKTQATTQGYMATNKQREALKLRPVTPEKAAALKEEGYEAAGEDDQGRVLYPESTLMAVDRNKLQRDRDALNYQTSQDKIKSSEAIAEENRKHREKLAQSGAGHSWARLQARLQADLQKARAKGESGEFEKEKLDNLAKIENIYHKGVIDLAKRFKFADEYNSRTADELTGSQAVEYWTERLTIEKRLREGKNLMESLYARQKGVDQPHVYQPEEGETYATSKLEEIKTKAQGAPAAAQSGQPQPDGNKLSLPPGLKLPAGYTEVSGGQVQGPDGSRYRLDPQSKTLKKIK